MTKKVDIATPDMTLQEAAKRMKEGDYGVLPVGEGDRLIGMITDRDIAVRAVAQGKNPQATKIREIMSDEVLYCYDDQPVSEVTRNMGEKQIRRLPVVNRNKRLVGILSLGDVAVHKSESVNTSEAISHISEHEHREPCPQVQ